MFRLESQTRRATVLCLSEVNREWRAVLEELRWQVLYMTPKSTKDLNDFVREVLPRIKQHVRKICIGKWDFHD
ncbi:hypothetical protein JCM3774_005195 [Rhodotorula dairenensis]